MERAGRTGGPTYVTRERRHGRTHAATATTNGPETAATPSERIRRNEHAGHAMTMHDDTAAQTGTRENGMADRMPTVHVVGTRYEGWRRPGGDEPRYNYRYGNHELALCLANISTAERMAFQENEPEFGYWWDPPVLWTLVRIPGMEWSDAPYTIHLVEPDGRIIDNPEPGKAAPVTMLMVENTTGEILEIRVASMSRAMTKDFAELARRQMEVEFDQEEYEQTIALRWSQYPKSADMIRRAHRMGVLGENAEHKDRVNRRI